MESSDPARGEPASPAARAAAAEDPRVPLAAERTLLAWIRTGLALMGFCFVLACYDLFLHELAAGDAPPRRDHLSHWVGIALVVAGVLVNVLATAQHVSFLRHLSRGVPRASRAVSLGTLLSVVLAALGLVLGVYLAFQR